MAAQGGAGQGRAAQGGAGQGRAEPSPRGWPGADLGVKEVSQGGAGGEEGGVSSPRSRRSDLETTESGESLFTIDTHQGATHPSQTRPAQPPPPPPHRRALLAFFSPCGVSSERRDTCDTDTACCHCNKNL